jgi:hypothetical protein
MPARCPAACSVGESSKRDGPGSFVPLVSLCQFTELLSDKAAE